MLSHPVNRSGGPIVLASVDQNVEGAATLLQAQALATALEGTLMILHVVPRPLLWGHKPTPAARDSLREGLRDWSQAMLGAPVEPNDIQVGAGSFVKETALFARAVEATVVAVPTSVFTPAMGARGPRAGDRLLRSVVRPVLFAGTQAGQARVVAATDLSSPWLPVVRVAARMARSTGGRVLAVHNARISASPATTPALPGLEPWRELRRLAADRSAHPPVDIVLTARPCPATAIVEIAERRDAGLIVTGRRLSRLGTVPRRRGRTLRALLGSTDRSILAVPVTLPDA